MEKRRIFQAPLSGQAPRSALFLDRDGVLIEDRHHLSDPRDVRLCTGSLQLLRHACQLGWPVVVITNQSGIARGYFDWQAYERVTGRLVELLGADAQLAAIYANGHGPDAPANSWRKPSPAMLLVAAEDLNLDLSRSLLVGDRLSDLQAGARAGLALVAHVLSGHGKCERSAVMSYADQGGRFTGEIHQPQLLLLDYLHDFPLQLMGSTSQLTK